MILPLYNSLAPLTLMRRFAAASAEDPDAAAYLDAVEVEDGQALEAGVRAAVNDFVVGCKSDGIWSAIKASCILAGARTLSGALVPLVGTAPTNNNFVSADYDRETGLKGNGSTKYLDSGRNNNADPQNDHHMSVFYSEPEAFVTGGKFTMGAGGNAAGSSNFGRRGNNGNLFIRNRSSALNDTLVQADVNNTFCGNNRSSSGAYNYRYNNTTSSITQSSETPYNGNVHVFRDNTAGLNSLSRLAFYSIGESLDLAALDNRVSTLMTDLAAAIP